MEIQKNKHKKHIALALVFGIISGFLIGHIVGVTDRGELPVFQGSLEFACLDEGKALQTCLDNQALIQVEELKASLPKIDAFFPEMK